MSGILCIGGANIDRRYATLGPVLFDSSNPACASTHFGGVARNVAENLARLGHRVQLLSRLGDDDAARALLTDLQLHDVDASAIECAAGVSTAEYAAIVDPQGNLVLGVVDARAIDSFGIAQLERNANAIAAARWVFFDTNISAECIAWLYAFRHRAGFELAADGVSEAKVHRLGDDLSGLHIVFLKDAQARAYLDAPESATAAQLANRLRERGAQNVIVTQGAQGCTLASSQGVSVIPAVAAKPVDATGAGDALVAATLHRILAGDVVQSAARTGSLLAALTVEAVGSVVPDLTPASLERESYRLAR